MRLNGRAIITQTTSMNDNHEQLNLDLLLDGHAVKPVPHGKQNLYMHAVMFLACASALEPLGSTSKVFLVSEQRMLEVMGLQYIRPFVKANKKDPQRYHQFNFTKEAAFICFRILKTQKAARRPTAL